MKCKECGNKLVLCTSDATYWTPDSEPYDGGKEEEAEEFEHDVKLIAEYCEKCGEFDWVQADEYKTKAGKTLEGLKETIDFYYAKASEESESTTTSWGHHVSTILSILKIRIKELEGKE